MMAYQIEAPATEQTKREQAVALERRRWWELRECYARCVQIARDEWDAALDAAEREQYELAIEMRDRVREGTRATGAKFAADVGVPVPLLTPRDKLQFLKECSVTLFIEACKKFLPVTPEAKRAAQEANATISATDEADCFEEARLLAEAGEAVITGTLPEGTAGTLAVSGAP